MYPLTSLFRGWRAALLLVAVACAAPGRATAGCGDHVVVLNAKPAGSDGHAVPSAPGATELPARPQSPCSGPNCSRLPDRHVPPVAPVSASEPHAKEAAQALDRSEPSACASSRTFDDTSPRPIRRAPSIFHPPRLG